MKPFYLLAAVFVPPFAVYLRRGFAGAFWLNLLLTLLLYLPGLIHAIAIVRRNGGNSS